MKTIYINFVKEGTTAQEEEKNKKETENLGNFYSNLMGITPTVDEKVESKSQIVQQFEFWKNEEVQNHFMIPKSNIGYRMLEKSGWKEKGLGKNEDGRIYPITAGTVKEKIKKNQKKEKTLKNITKGWINKMEKERKQKEETSRNLIFRGF